MKTLKKENTLVIADLHLPFSRKGYLEHCAKVREDYNCKRVVFIGDIIDNHYSSYHEQDPDGYSAGEELERAVDQVAQWYKVFNKAEVTLGNHDQIVQRQAYTAGLSNRWIKGYSDVLKTKNWNFGISFQHDSVLYIHGSRSSGQSAAISKVKEWGVSVVQGHIHTECSVIWTAHRASRKFGMIVGWGGDEDTYAFAYGRDFPKRGVVSCGVILNGGENAFNIPMNL